MLELLTTIYLIFVSQLAVLCLTAGFASMLVMKKHVMSVYEGDIEDVLHYTKVKSNQLSFDANNCVVMLKELMH